MRNLVQQGESSQNIINVHIFVSEFWFWEAPPYSEVMYGDNFGRHYSHTLCPGQLLDLISFDLHQRLQSAAMLYFFLFKMKLKKFELHKRLVATFVARYSIVA